MLFQGIAEMLHHAAQIVWPRGGQILLLEGIVVELEQLIVRSP